MAENLKIATHETSSPETGALAPVVQMPSAQKPKPESDFPFSVMVGDVYEGPLDLLLDLIRKQDIDIYDIPIARITANLAAGANNGNSEIYVKNLLTGAVTLVSTDANGVPGNGPSLLPMFSPDGSKVAFHSSSSNLTPGTSGNSEVYVKDLAGGAITLISTDINGAAANSNDSMLAVFSPDGTKVAFESSATNLVPGGTSGQQVFVKDLLTGEVTLMSADTNGVQGNSPSSDPNFSPDHKAVALAIDLRAMGVCVVGDSPRA